MRYYRRIPTLCAIVALAACGSESTTPRIIADASGVPADNIILGLEHFMTRDGIRTGVLNSDTAFFYQDSRKMDLRTVALQFFADNGAPSGTLTSVEGEYDTATGSFVARGNVVLITRGPQGEQRRLETDELHYDVGADRLWSDVPFVLNENGRETRGESFRSDAEFRNWSVQGARTSGGLPTDETGGARPAEISF